jgi:hypothetical protein
MLLDGFRPLLGPQGGFLAMRVTVREWATQTGRGQHRRCQHCDQHEGDSYVDENNGGE